MSRRLIVGAGAEDDIDVAYRWYEERSNGLGERFLDEVESCSQRGSLNPLSFPEVEASVRRALLHVFPYLVIFTVNGPTVHVLAVVHAAQDPAYVADRLDA